MSGRKIDINKASVDELSTLIGVGRAKAEAIFEARKVKGGYKSINELKDVSGIGPSILEQNQGLVHCGRAHTKPKVVERESTTAMGVSCDSYSLRDRVETSTSNNEVYCLRDREQVKKGACLTKCAGTSARENKTDHDAHDTAKPSSSNSSFRQYRTPSEEEEDSVEACRGTNNPIVDGTVFGSPNVSRDEEAGPRPFELLSESESSSSQEDCDSSQDTEANRTSSSNNVCGVKKKVSLAQEDSLRDSPVSVGVVAALRSRSSLTLAEKSVMKRKSDGGGSKDGSPEKKPCRSSSEPATSVGGVSPVSSAQVTSTKPEKSISSHPLLRKGRIPSKANPPPELANWLKIFQEWSHPERLMALDELVELCEPTQVRHVMAVIEPQFQRDFISLLPKELALYVLSYLEPKDLCRAAQTCRYWRMLGEDNILWREKCKEESIDESLVYENRSRRRSGCSRSPWKTMYLHQKQIEYN